MLVGWFLGSLPPSPANDGSSPPPLLAQPGALPAPLPAFVVAPPPVVVPACSPAVTIAASPPSASPLPTVSASPAPRGFTRVARGNHSSFECSAGNQVFDMLLLETQLPEFPPVDDVFMRVCLLRDVCLVGGRLTYYVDAELDAATPSNCRISALTGSKGGFVLPSYIKGHDGRKAYNPDLVVGARPPHLHYAPADRTYMLGELSHAENYAHLIVDTVLPAYAAADAYGLDAREVQLVGLADCSTMETAHDFNPSTGAPNSADCEANLAKWFAPLMEHPLLPAGGKDVCFERLIFGHEMSFSLAGMYLHRAAAIRAARARLYERLGVSPTFTATAHAIAVLEKVPRAAPIAYASVCSDVQAWAAALDPPPAVECFRPGALTVAEQLTIVARSSLVVAEHGSTTYMSLFQAVGSSLVVVVPSDEMHAKEVQVLLYNTDVQVWYVRAKRLLAGEGPGTMLMALERAGRRLSLPPIRLAPGTLPFAGPAPTNPSAKSRDIAVDEAGNMRGCT